jgi:hypothetical protein
LSGLDSVQAALGCAYDFEDRPAAATTASGASGVSKGQVFSKKVIVGWGRVL